MRRGIETDQMIGVGVELHSMLAERVLDLIAGRFEDFRRVHPADIRGDRPRIDARHFQDVLEQTIQSLDFRQNQVALLAAIGIVQPRRLKIAGRDADGGQRRSQIVTERCEQRRLELLALPRQFSRLALFEKLRALHGDGRHPGQRIERRRLDRLVRQSPAARPPWRRTAAAPARTACPSRRQRAMPVVWSARRRRTPTRSSAPANASES